MCIFYSHLTSRLICRHKRACRARLRAACRRWDSGGNVSEERTWSGRERRSTRWCGRSPTASSPARCARATKLDEMSLAARFAGVAHADPRGARPAQRDGAGRQAAQPRRHRRRRDAGASVLDVRKHGRAGGHLRPLFGRTHDRRRAPGARARAPGVGAAGPSRRRRRLRGAQHRVPYPALSRRPQQAHLRTGDA